jgi:hypothetical protein
VIEKPWVQTPVEREKERKRERDTQEGCLIWCWLKWLKALSWKCHLSEWDIRSKREAVLLIVTCTLPFQWLAYYAFSNCEVSRKETSHL